MMDINLEHVVLRNRKRRKGMEMAGIQQVCRESFFLFIYILIPDRSFLFLPDAFETNEAKQESAELMKSRIKSTSAGTGCSRIFFWIGFH